MLTDIEIANACKMKDIREVAAELGVTEDRLELYGKYKAKLTVPVKRRAKLILVTAINPTASGEGKTTVSIGLADGMRRLGKKVCLALREPSLGPVFGVKGGAAGGGYAQVVPMEDINLHFTGDLHAITAANDLLAALIDNHIYQGNALDIDPDKVWFHRCLDMNDRALRYATVGGNGQGVERRESFEITAASEVMATLCLASDLADLKRRLGNIIVGANRAGEYVYARDLKAEGAMATLLKDAIKPNLVQTLEGTPAIVHGGPFANIAHGCNSVIATSTAMTLSDYTVTEAGFGADLGAEKFLDVKCRAAGVEPSAVVVVATVKALKLHGGANKADLAKEDLAALAAGLPNLVKHVENIGSVFHKPVVVALNRFATDTEKELAFVTDEMKKRGAEVAFTDVFLKGGEGGEALARAVLAACEKPSSLAYAYELSDPISVKIEKIVKKIYGGAGVDITPLAAEKIADAEARGYGKYPVIIAKTQYSLSDDPKLLARPEGFRVTVRDVTVKGGAEFVVAVCGSIMLMPGLSKSPAAERIDVDGEGRVTGLF